MSNTQVVLGTVYCKKNRVAVFVNGKLVTQTCHSPWWYSVCAPLLTLCNPWTLSWWCSEWGHPSPYQQQQWLHLAGESWTCAAVLWLDTPAVAAQHWNITLFVTDLAKEYSACYSQSNVKRDSIYYCWTKSLKKTVSLNMLQFHLRASPPSPHS